MTSLEKSTFRSPHSPLLSLFLHFCLPLPPNVTFCNYFEFNFSVLIGFVFFFILCGATAYIIVIFAKKIGIAVRTVAALYFCFFYSIYFLRQRRCRNFRIFFSWLRCGCLYYSDIFFSIMRRELWRIFAYVIMPEIFLALPVRQHFVRLIARLHCRGR